MAITDAARTAINNTIKTNGTGAIKGSNLNSVLQNILTPIEAVSDREIRDARTINNGARVELGYLWSIDGANSGIKANSSWDCAYVSLQDNATRLEILGATHSQIVYFSSSEIIPSNFIGNNMTGKVPTGAKFCVINLRKSDNPDGYSQFAVRQNLGFIKTGEFSRKSVRILSVGNSYSQDALSYVPFIMRNIDPSVDVEIGILYKSGATISNHLDSWNQAKADYTLYRFTAGSNAWTNAGTKSIQDALALQTWDIIMFQQVSTSSWTYSNFSNLGPLMNAISGALKYPVRFAWMITMNRPKNGDTVYSQSEFDAHWTGIADCARQVWENYPFDLCFPVGTAIENARTTSLNSLGAYGKLTYEGAHLQEGLPCMIAAYAVVIELLDAIGLGHRGIVGDQTRATDSWLAGKAIPGSHGSSVGVNDQNAALAQSCVMMAHKKKFEKTQIV